MTQSEINDIFDATIKRSRDVLCSKADEYVGQQGDRLSNFKHAAHLQNLCLPAALGGMMCKHTVSVYDMIGRYQNGETFSEEKWDEKIGDSLNYLILLKAVLIEEQKSKSMPAPVSPAPTETAPTDETLPFDNCGDCKHYTGKHPFQPCNMGKYRCEKWEPIS